MLMPGSNPIMYIAASSLWSLGSCMLDKRSQALLFTSPTSPCLRFLDRCAVYSLCGQLLESIQPL